MVGQDIHFFAHDALVPLTLHADDIVKAYLSQPQNLILFMQWNQSQM